ncbi:MAG: hypothetical protein HY905_25280 [Deltaproteobacteria bacterium]|nr:hypothetical protein [Deltaproteobacteria bacterium]
MRISVGRLVVVLCLVASLSAVGASGCSDDDGGGGAAVTQCNALVDTICSRMVTCAAYATAAECRTDLLGVLNCSAAVGIGPTYSACMTAVPAIDCAAFSGSTWLPTSCNGVILMP